MRFVPAACAVIALCAAVAALIPVLRPVGWNLTALPRVATNTGMGTAARAIDPGFRTVSTGDYDGQFYWGVAVDPIATGDVHQSFDTASYRYGHPLLGWLGWLLSAGHAREAPAALLGVGLASLMLAALTASALERALGGRGLAGLFVALNPGLIYASVHDLAEPLSAALLLSGLFAYMRGRRALTVVCFACLVLSKEQFVLVPVALAAWEILRRRGRFVESVLLLAGVVPAAGWWIYARLQLGAWFTSGTNAVGVPLAGWKRALADAGIDTYSQNATQNIAAESALVVFVALLLLLLVAAVLAFRLRGPIEAAYILLAALAVCLIPSGTVFLRDALRNLSVLLTLVPFVLGPVPLMPTWRPRPARPAADERAPRRASSSDA